MVNGRLKETPKVMMSVISIAHEQKPGMQIPAIISNKARFKIMP
jgi:hypothetical protein